MNASNDFDYAFDPDEPVYNSELMSPWYDAAFEAAYDEWLSKKEVEPCVPEQPLSF